MPSLNPMSRVCVCVCMFVLVKSLLLLLSSENTGPHVSIQQPQQWRSLTTVNWLDETRVQLQDESP